MAVEQITVNSATYNVAQASAVDQKKLVLMIGSKIALNSARGGVEEIDERLLFGAFLTLDENTFDQVARIVLARTYLNGEESPIELKQFQGRMVEYFQLVAAAVKVNLNDFFTYLDSVNSETRKAARKGTALPNRG